MASFAPLAAVLLPVAVVVGALVFWRRSRTSARELDRKLREAVGAQQVRQDDLPSKR
jgi:uncharacterized Tic20 family protein